MHEPSGKITLFVGAASGGVWKSEDGGTRYKPVFDEQPVQSIGAVALDPKNSKNVWVGTGESWTRNSVSIGNGIYKSTDGGETWTHAGLPNSERIAKIVVQSDKQRHGFRGRAGRALERFAGSRALQNDGWRQDLEPILKGANLSTGCSDIAMDPTDPNMMFAAMWDFRRKGWTFRSGGDGPDGAFGQRTVPFGRWRRDLDGNHARELTKVFRRSRMAGSRWRSRHRMRSAFTLLSNRTDSALFVSDDGGATWDKRDKSNWMVWRPFYFAKLIVDPKNPDRVFKTDGALILSEDAGKSFAIVGGFQGAHGDVHDVWIDPTNPQTVIRG